VRADISTGGGNVGALQGRLQQARNQLNDWTTCVSAKTTKGQAEIQKLSGEVSADEQKIARSQLADAAASSSSRVGQPDRLVDVWA
jgi:DNA anti-recombination protein RmuC